MSIGLLFLIAALVCFILGSIGVSSRVGLTDLGLAFVTGYLIAGGF